MVQEVVNIINSIAFDQEFVVDIGNDKVYTYNEFFSLAIKEADYIEKSVKGSDLIAVAENSFELFLLYFAVMLTNKRILVIDPQKGKDEILDILNEVETTGLIADMRLAADLHTKHNLVPFPDIDSKSDINTKKAIIDRLGQRDSNIPYLVTFTSGTSGKTKGVEHTLDNLFLTALSLNEKVNKKGGTFLHVMPMTYMAGILNSIIYPFIAEARIVISRRFSILVARNFWDTVIKYDINLFWLSPSMLMMIDQMDRGCHGEKYCKDHNPVFLIGTAPLPKEMRHRFNSRYGVEVLASYGLSETLFVSVETKDSLRNAEQDCVGEVLSGVEYCFEDNGEIYIKVPWMFLKYTNEDTEKYFEGKYYKSGDLARIKDGFLYITGRSKDLIIKGGMNISPVLIENVVNRNEYIYENAVLGVKDKRGEEKICCVYQLRKPVEDKKNFETGLKKKVIEELGKNYAIDYLWEVDSIPRNINGKTDKNVIREEWNKNNE